MNRWMGIFLVSMIASLWGLSLAKAQEPPPAGTTEDSSKDNVIYKKTTIIDFSDVTITGELTKPEGSYLMNKKRAQFNLLINVRDNFLSEIVKTVDNL